MLVSGGGGVPTVTLGYSTRVLGPGSPAGPVTGQYRMRGLLTDTRRGWSGTYRPCS